MRERNSAAVELLESIDAFLQDERGATEFQSRYAFFRTWFSRYRDSYLGFPDDALPRTQFDYFSEVYEKACDVSPEEWPTDEELSYGRVSLRSFILWLNEKRRDYVETTV